MKTECVPFLDLVTPHRQLREELTAAFTSLLDRASFIGGEAVDGFEAAFASFCGTRHCVGVNSGTDALRFVLIAVGVKPGDVVVTVPNSFIATTEAITQVGALPEFVDIDERTYNMDPFALHKYLETNCRKSGGRLISRRWNRPITAVVPVHLYGQSVDMDPILILAEQYGLKVVEDACQAHGAEYFSQRDQRWHKTGSMGHAAAFSFYPGKNLGACGEAGAVTTNDDAVARTCRMLRDHGQQKKYYHEISGYNGRLDAIQAAILNLKLAKLPRWNEERRDAAAIYDELFNSHCPDVVVPFVPAYARPVYHLYVVRVIAREELRAQLDQRNVGTGIHYPIPLHLQEAHRTLGYHRGSFPVTEMVASQVLSLPMYPHITGTQQQYVAEATKHSIRASNESCECEVSLAAD